MDLRQAWFDKLTTFEQGRGAKHAKFGGKSELSWNKDCPIQLRLRPWEVLRVVIHPY